jgi:hypothetical protein
MADLGLRPLTLGEILDRTFSLYRKHFLLFFGITVIPHLLILAVSLTQTFFISAPRFPGSVPRHQFQTAFDGSVVLAFVIGILAGIAAYVVAYLFSQGATVFAVSELYLGRTTTIGASFGRMRGHLLNLFVVILLNGLAVLAGFICLIIPGIYVLCRLITCIPAALLEDIGPIDSLERSFSLTKDFAGRSFLIYLLYWALSYGATLLFAMPFSFAAIFLGLKNPEVMRTWTALANVGTFVAGVLVAPVLTIATAVFYYDLRVRKEAFDLQIMLNPNDPLAQGPSIVPRTLY